MPGIALVTDSTSDIPLDMAIKFNINVIPLKVVFGNKEYRDGIDLKPDEFYQKLDSSDSLPTTSLPAPSIFTELYEDLLEYNTDVVSVHLSTGLSGTVNAARLAAERFRGKIHVFDSKSISLGVGLLVLEAARNIQSGLSASEIMKKLETVRQNSETLFTLNTLEYLRKGGRIGKVSSLLGTMLNIKPVVRVNEEGIYTPFGKTRTQEQALTLIEKGLAQLAAGRQAISLAVAHGAAPEAGNSLRSRMESLFNLKASIFTQVGPVIGVHTGPGAVGAAVLYK